MLVLLMLVLLYADTAHMSAASGTNFRRNQTQFDQERMEQHQEQHPTSPVNWVSPGVSPGAVNVSNSSAQVSELNTFIEPLNMLFKGTIALITTVLSFYRRSQKPSNNLHGELTERLSQLTTRSNYVRKITEDLPTTQLTTCKASVTQLLDSLDNVNESILKNLQDAKTLRKHKLYEADEAKLIGYLHICGTFVEKYGSEYKLPGRPAFIDVDIFRIKSRLDTLLHQVKSE